MRERDGWLVSGLLLVTFATLLIELLDSRLVSVLTWYHLSFLAVSLAMLGMAAGAVLVFLSGERLEGRRARRAVERLSLLLALAIPVCHLLLLRLRIPPVTAVTFEKVLPLAVATMLITVPFLVSGAVVTLALTRCGGRIGRLYGADLVGAACGCLLIVPLLELADLFSVTLVAAAAAAAGAFCFARFAAKESGRLPALAALALMAGAVGHATLGVPIDVEHPKALNAAPRLRDLSIWNAYSHVIVLKPVQGPPFFWGRGESPDDLEVIFAGMLIDGGAGTVTTRWNGDPATLDWVRYDVTTLPHHLRSGRVGIIGPGGGRDILAAIWAGASTIVAVELNRTFVDILTRTHRSFAGIADRPEVRLVHDEARSFLTRSDDRFDVLQMSLVDTWAATGAGAFTLSENALYTTEAWSIFLDRLSPTGIFSTSRWFSPERVSESSRLLALCVATLLERGVEEPAAHIALIARGKVANLMVSAAPFTDAEVTRLRELGAQYRFTLLALPGQAPDDPRLRQILASRARSELDAAVRDPLFDYTPPSDQRPYFFNMLKPRGFLSLSSRAVDQATGQGVIRGNLSATLTLAVLFGISLVLTVAIILLPLVLSGLPQMDGGSLLLALGYFAAIGYGFMSIQIPLLQRFSVYLGHPIYTYSVILFTMILCAGLGSLLSDRLSLAAGAWHVVVPTTVAMLLLMLMAIVGPVLRSTVEGGLGLRIAVVAALTAPVSTLLGFCFPFGMRLVSSLSERATAWMWGVNGACGVIASILAVAVSIWGGIYVNLVVAAALYLLVALLAGRLAIRAPAAR